MQSASPCCTFMRPPRDADRHQYNVCKVCCRLEITRTKSEDIEMKGHPETGTNMIYLAPIDCVAFMHL